MRRLATAAALLAIALSAAFGLPRLGASGSLGHASLDPYSSGRYSYEGLLPAGWQRSRKRLVPLLMPREVLSVGTFPMPAGGGGNCGREPVAAIRRMRRGDALISIQEYVVTARMRPLSSRFPPKSTQLDLVGAAPRATIPFSESGRALEALVYFRGQPTAALRRAASRALAELRFGPRD